MTDFLGQLQKDHGEEIGSFGGTLVDADRIPTGLFPLDLALAGGFPRGTASIIYGPESSGKTNIVLKAIAMHQLLWPDDVNVFFDVENGFDPVLGASGSASTPTSSSSSSRTTASRSSTWPRAPCSPTTAASWRSTASPPS